MNDPTFIKVDGKPGVRPTIVEFMVDGLPIRVSINDGILGIYASEGISITPISSRAVNIGHKIHPCSAG